MSDNGTIRSVHDEGKSPTIFFFFKSFQENSIRHLGSDSSPHFCHFSRYSFQLWMIV